MPRKVGPDDPTRVYKSDIMERLTRAHPAEPFVVFIPVVIIAMYFALANASRGVGWDLLMFPLGVLFWTFCEYVLHRVIFHYDATSKAGKKIMLLIHGVHHHFPNDTDRLVIPPFAGIMVGAGGLGIFTLLFGFWGAIPFWAGWVTGYMAYDWVHYSTHARKPATFLGKAQRRRHSLHHYKYPHACYGVSTGLWDWVFRTRAVDAEASEAHSGKPDGNWKIRDNKVGRAESAYGSKVSEAS